MLNTTDVGNENTGNAQIKYPLETRKRLSKSMLWTLQRNYYLEHGQEVWNKAVIPHYITCNSYISRAYAKVILGFMRDCCLKTLKGGDRTVYILELGSGTGQFAYGVVKILSELLTGSSLENISFKYILTDFNEEGVDYLKQHPSFQPFIENGCVDFAVFDAAYNKPIKLEHSGEILTTGSLKSPLVVLANYVFDSIPQDSFYVGEGLLYEKLINLYSTQEESDHQDSSTLLRLIHDFDCIPIDYNTYYEDKGLNDLLGFYKSNVDYSNFTIPINTINSIRNLRNLTEGSMLLLSADRGYIHEKSLSFYNPPDIVKHGCISSLVNYHAIGRYFSNCGGDILCTDYNHRSINVVALLLNEASNPFPETKAAYRDAIADFGPDDFYTLSKAIMPNCSDFSNDELLACIRFSNWDFRIFLQMYATLKERTLSERAFPCEDLFMSINKVWDYYFPIGDNEDLAFCMGVLLSNMGYYKDTIRFMNYSAGAYGLQPDTCYYIGQSYYYLGQLENSKFYMNKAYSMKPDSEDYTVMCRRIAAELKAGLQKADS